MCYTCGDYVLRLIHTWFSLGAGNSLWQILWPSLFFSLIPTFHYSLGHCQKQQCSSFKHRPCPILSLQYYKYGHLLKPQYLLAVNRVFIYELLGLYLLIFYRTYQRGKHILNMASDSGVTLASFRFLDLPAEIRNMFYRKLLSTSDTYQGYCDFNPPRPDYQLHPSILRVNHQLYGEAHTILYDENTWTVLKTSFDDSSVENYPWACQPIILGKESAIHRPALTIIVKKRKTRANTKRFFTFVLGPESLDRYIMCMFQSITDITGDHSTGDLSIQLLLARSKAHSRNQLQSLLLAPVFKVQGYTAVSIVGNVECDFGIHLFTQMIGRMDNADKIKTIVQNLVTKGHAAYSLGRKYEACIVWHDAIRYTLQFNSLCHGGLGPASGEAAQAIETQLAEIRLITYLDIGRCLIQNGHPDQVTKHYYLASKLSLPSSLTKSSYKQARVRLYGSLGYVQRKNDELAQDLMERSFCRVGLDLKLSFKLIRECEQLMGPEGFATCPITEAFFNDVRKHWVKRSWVEIFKRVKLLRRDGDSEVPS